MRFGQSTRRRITSPRLLTVSTQHVPPQSPRAGSDRHTTPEAPAGSPDAESGRAEGSQEPKSTRAGGRAQKLTRRARIRIVAAINMRFRISREFLHASQKGIETNVSARSPRPVLVRLCSNLSNPPILLRLLLSSRTLLASLRSLTTRSMYARGVTVNQGWREADDYPTEARVSTDVSEGGSQAVMNLRETNFGARARQRD